MNWPGPSPKRLRAMLVVLLAWAALLLAVGQCACAEEHHGAGNLESAVCLVLAAVVVFHAGAPRRGRLRFMRATSSVLPSPVHGPPATLALSAARGSPIFTSRFRC